MGSPPTPTLGGGGTWKVVVVCGWYCFGKDSNERFFFVIEIVAGHDLQTGYSLRGIYIVELCCKREENETKSNLIKLKPLLIIKTASKRGCYPVDIFSPSIALRGVDLDLCKCLFSAFSLARETEEEEAFPRIQSPCSKVHLLHVVLVLCVPYLDVISASNSILCGCILYKQRSIIRMTKSHRIHGDACACRRKRWRVLKASPSIRVPSGKSRGKSNKDLLFFTFLLQSEKNEGK